MTNKPDIAVLHRTLSVPSAGHRGKRPEQDHESFSIDFVIDGVPMSHLFKHLDVAGMFMHRSHRFFREGTYNAELKAGFADVTELPRRPNLYSTCYCEDPWCGAVTCDVSRSDRTISWSAVADECGYIEGRELFSAIGPFGFDAEQYADVIDRAARGET